MATKKASADNTTREPDIDKIIAGLPEEDRVFWQELESEFSLPREERAEIARRYNEQNGTA